MEINQSEEIKVVAVDPKKIKKQHAIRLTVTIVAAVITVLFFWFSISLFSIAVAALIFAVIVSVVALAVISIYKNWDTPYKLSITALYIAVVLLIGLFACAKSGLLKKIEAEEDLIKYINNSGGVVEVVFVLLNFLQVTIVPIPSSITTTAGAILFTGIWKPLYLTVIGLVLGSMFAFFLGRVFGVRFANWLVGEKTIEKYKRFTKGRDKVVLFYMFLFPFFPDDFLCILAGMTNYTYLGFFLLQIFCRTVGTLTSILITKGIVSIPLQGPWLFLWGFIIIVVVFFLIVTIRYSDKLEAITMKVIDKLTFGYTAKCRAAKEAAEAAAQKEVDGDSPETEAEFSEKENSTQSDIPPQKGDENDTFKH